MDEVIDALGSLIAEMEDDEVKAAQDTTPAPEGWVCDGCCARFTDSPAKILMGQKAVPFSSSRGFVESRFCGNCAPSVGKSDLLETVPISKLTGVPVDEQQEPEEPVEQATCPECGAGWQSCVANDKDFRLLLLSCPEGHQWEVDLRGAEHA